MLKMHIKNFKKFINYYKPYKKSLFLDLFFYAILTGIVVVIPIVLRYIMDKVIFLEYKIAINQILMLSLLILTLIFVQYFCIYGITHFGETMGVEIEKDMRNEIFSHFQKLSLNFYDNIKIGELLSRITVDISNISNFLHLLPEEMMSIILKFILVSIIFFMTNWKIAVISIFTFLATCIYIYYFMPKLSKYFNKNYKEMAKINSQIEEVLSGIRVVKSFVRENLEIEKIESKNMDFVKNKKITIKILSWGFSGMWSMMDSFIPLIVIIGSILILHKNLNLIDIVFFINYESILVNALYSLSKLLETMGQSVAGFNRFCEILEIKPDIIDKKDACEIKDCKGEIKFKNVNFKYKNIQKILFENLNFCIKSQEYVALVGTSGSGKTTLCNLISRFYDIESGNIFIDNINISDIKLKSLRNNVGLVQQDIYLFSGTIKENIIYGNLEASDDEIILAAKNAYAHEFITKFPDGYDTNVGQRGTTLSGGQKQRISIARAFLKDPKILILDETTSALDNESEKYIQKSIAKLSKNRTTIVIAHKLSTIRNAKRILVLSDGKIVEEGTHDELMANGKAYFELYNLL
ncbi:MAG: ABC transporter ATP-binding protein [Candidatus Improbicoccus devescovinae]|nr:MAG: ABC transporter ATP-binding protein [Candidatus Improbicoccus devescovinae]